MSQAQIEEIVKMRAKDYASSIVLYQTVYSAMPRELNRLKHAMRAIVRGMIDFRAWIIRDIIADAVVFSVLREFKDGRLTEGDVRKLVDVATNAALEVLEEFDVAAIVKRAIEIAASEVIGEAARYFKELLGSEEFKNSIREVTLVDLQKLVTL